MAQYDESGLRLFLVENEHFRFQDLATYQMLKGQRLKEVDFCWHERSEQNHNGQAVQQSRIILLELKEFTRSRSTLLASDFTDKAHRFETLINKIVDSLLLLAAAWLGTEKGSTLFAELPAFARQRLPIKIIIGLDLPATLRTHLGVLRDKLNARLRGRMALLDIDRVAVLSYQQLLLKYPQFVVENP
jgi:hypothetical protein